MSIFLHNRLLLVKQLFEIGYNGTIIRKKLSLSKVYLTCKKWQVFSFQFFLFGYTMIMIVRVDLYVVVIEEY